MAGTVRCRGCGAENASGQRFCGACGSPLQLVCSSCGSENPGAFRFCGGCGTSLAEAPPRGTMPSGERRWVTVLFADLSGYTRLSEGMDPEDVRTMANRCLERMGAIVEDFGGTVLSVMGDGFMAAFGAPVAHEDDPERAVRAGLEMQACAAEHAEDFGRLPLRVGINTGEVMFADVGPEGRRDPTLTGDTTNTASRLESAAPSNGVLVGEETYHATRRTIRYEGVEPLRLKGKEGLVPAWLALEAEGEPARRPLSETSLVGRAAELDALRTVWDRVVGDRQPHLVTVLGPPGIGKTKLAREFVEMASAVGGRSLWGRSLPYGEQVGYGAFGQLAKAAAGIYETDEASVALAKLGASVRELVPPEGVEGTTMHLGVLVGLETDAEVEKKGLFGAARAFVEGLGAETPTVLVFEDVQWADPALLELVEWLGARVANVPVLFLAVSRPELLESRPGWGGGLAAYSALPIGPLPRRDVRELVARLLPEGGLEDDVIERVQRIAAGNPLFVEELAAWISDESRDPTKPIPTTVTAMISARLDTLAPHLRTLLLEASVVGETFWLGALGGTDEDGGTADALDELEARDLVRRERTSRIQGDTEYSFKHVLIREVAYATLPKALRRERHRDVARYLEDSAGTGGVSTTMLAHHWEEAGEREQAISYLVRAGDQAARGWAQGEAVKLYARALDLVGEEDEDARRDIVKRRAVARAKMFHALVDVPEHRHRTAARGGDAQRGKSSGETSPPIS